jgi:hypothetical protein
MQTLPSGRFQARSQGDTRARFIHPNPDCEVCHGLSHEREFSNVNTLKYPRRGTWFPARCLKRPVNEFIQNQGRCSFCALIVDAFWYVAQGLGYQVATFTLDLAFLEADVLLPTGNKGHCTLAFHTDDRGWRRPFDTTAIERIFERVTLLWGNKALEISAPRKCTV